MKRRRDDGSQSSKFSEDVPLEKREKMKNLKSELKKLIIDNEENCCLHISIIPRNYDSITITVSQPESHLDIIFIIKLDSSATKEEIESFSVNFFHPAFLEVEEKEEFSVLYREEFTLESHEERVNQFISTFNKLKMARKCPHLVMNDYEKLRCLIPHVHHKSVLYYPTMNKSIGIVLLIDKTLVFKYHKCSCILTGKMQRSRECVYMSSYLLKMNIDSNIRLRLGLADEDDDSFYNTELFQNLKKAMDMGKLFEGMKLYKTLNDQAKMCCLDPYHVRIRNFPHTLGFSVSNLINGVDGLSAGSWEKINGVWVFQGNMITPSRYSLNNVLDLFRYNPGLQMSPIEVALIIFEALGTSEMWMCYMSDAMKPRVGVEDIKSGGFTYSIGVEDYGTIFPGTLNLLDDLEKMISLTQDLQALTFIQELRSVIKRQIRADENQCRGAWLYTQSYLSCQLRIMGRKRFLLVDVPLFYYYEKSSRNEQVQFMVESGTVYLMNAIHRGRERGLTCCKNAHLDSMVWDSDPAVNAYWNMNGVRTDDITSDEYPYILRLYSLGSCGDSNGVICHEISCKNDGEHMFKETRNHHIVSKGNSSSKKMILYVCRGDSWLSHSVSSSSPRNTESKKKHYLKPVTWRPILALHRYETSTPFIMKIGRTTDSSIEPSEREKQRTSLVREVYCERTVKGLKRLEQMYDTITNGSGVICGVRVSKEEIQGTICFIDDIRRMYNVIMRKSPGDNRDLKYIQYILKKFLRYVALFKKNKWMKYLFHYATIFKWIRICRAYVYHQNRMGFGNFIPYRVNSQNSVERHFMDMRCEKGHYTSPSLKEVHVRFPRVFLRKQDVVIRRHNAYSNEKKECFSEIILSEFTLSKISELREKEIEVLSRHLDELCRQVLTCPTPDEIEMYKRDLEQDLILKQHFVDRLFRMFKSASKTCNSTNRSRLVTEGLIFLTELSESGDPVRVKDSFFKLFLMIDKFVLKNIVDRVVHKCFVVLKEMFIRHLKFSYGKHFREVFKKCADVKMEIEEEEGEEEENAEQAAKRAFSDSIFYVLLEVWIRYRLKDIKYGTRFNPPKHSRSFRNERNQKGFK